MTHYLFSPGALSSEVSSAGDYANAVTASSMQLAEHAAIGMPVR